VVKLCQENTDTDIEALSPCFMNILNPVDAEFGEGVFLNVTEVLRQWIDQMGNDWRLVGDCLAAPPSEPVFSWHNFTTSTLEKCQL